MLSINTDNYSSHAHAEGIASDTDVGAAREPARVYA